ncbi:WbqC family protein [candidate division KSB1 bacterium]|nr:WbqC family protein [candidate division KSB1 bacterium]
MNKKVAIHQPNYIPWLGYFYKMAKCDVFVFLDIVQYPRGQSFASRNKIKTSNGPIFLTIPVNIPKGYEGKVKYTDVEFSDQIWKQKHLRTLELNYKRAKFFNEIFEIYKKQLLSMDNLIELNINLIQAFADDLGIDVETIRLSEILSEFGQKTRLIIDICNKLNANKYLSGTGGGKEYNDEKLLNDNGIELLYSDFIHPVYPQLWGDFIPNLSIIDLIFNCGPDSRNYLLKKNN